MDYNIDDWSKGTSPGELQEMADLWNGNAVGRHAFYSWTGELLAGSIAPSGKIAGRLVEARNDSGELLGFAHASLLAEEGYPPAGVVEMLMVDRKSRDKGIGTGLLAETIRWIESRRPRPWLVDALGAWPFGYVYNVLADGSERSGVFTRETALYRLFQRAGFVPVRKSIVMRADLAGVPARPHPPGSGFFIAPRREGTWLDRVFRGRELWDHELEMREEGTLSRSIFGLMEGESRQEGRILFSLFGVNTPADKQGRGYAGANLSHLMNHVRGLGGEVMELHVYADNKPALALYRGLGFKPVAETAMMHLQLR